MSKNTKAVPKVGREDSVTSPQLPPGAALRMAAGAPLAASAFGTGTMAVPIGPRALQLLEVAYRARRAVLLEGPTGVGKSQIVAELARTLGIGYLVLDLSLMEPPDLIGLPILEGGRTHYASPAQLPSDGCGILMLEELNRAEIPVMQPALQLLSARRLHAYELPPGWVCIAAVNPEDGDYQVNRLDPALRSRFMQVQVCADRTLWLEWALRSNVHPAIIATVRQHEGAFAMTPPRSWAYASDFLHVLHSDEVQDAELVGNGLRGYLPMAWALVVAEQLRALTAFALPEREVLFGADGAARLAAIVKGFAREPRLDGVYSAASRIRSCVSSAWFADLATRDALAWQKLEALLAALPGDLREQCLQAAAAGPAAAALLAGLGLRLPELLRAGDYAQSAARATIRKWHNDLQIANLQLVATATLQWLHSAPIVETGGVAAALALLAADLGFVGAPLAAWLRARQPHPRTPGDLAR